MFGDQSPGELVQITGTGTEQYVLSAFVPSDLPETVHLEPQTHTVVADASAALGKLSSAAKLLPEPQLLRRVTLRKEAHSSTLIEGTQTVLNEVLEVDSTEPDTQMSSALREVVNAILVADYGYSTVEQRSISISMLNEMQRHLLVGTRSEHPDNGSVRNTQAFIGPDGSPLAEARFVPPPPGSILTDCYDKWELWINHPHPNLAPVVQAAMAHYQFETIHPYSDGNGRLGRLIIGLQLLRAGLLSNGIFTISPWIERNRREYQDQLLNLSHSGNWDPWVRFFCQAVRAEANRTLNQIEELQDFQTRINEAVRSKGWRGLTADIANELIGYPAFTVKQAANRHGKTVNTANRSIKILVDAKILAESTGQRYNQVFVSNDVLQIINR